MLTLKTSKHKIIYAKVENGQILERQKQRGKNGLRLQNMFKRVSTKLDPKWYTYLNSSVPEVHYSIEEKLV